MKHRYRLAAIFIWLVFLGCAGIDRGCSSCCAQSFGADWIIIQLDLSGRPFRCWILNYSSVANEKDSDGIYWKDESSGNLVHISNLYNRIQVLNGNWDAAFRELGITEQECKSLNRLKLTAEKGE